MQYALTAPKYTSIPLPGSVDSKGAGLSTAAHTSSKEGTGNYCRPVNTDSSAPRKQVRETYSIRSGFLGMYDFAFLRAFVGTVFSSSDAISNGMATSASLF